jgi:hypothetical protein
MTLLLLKNIPEQDCNDPAPFVKKENKMIQGLGVLTALILIIALIVVGPFITIWALNTLFPALAIPFTFNTWLAVVCLGGVFKSRVSVNK